MLKHESSLDRLAGEEAEICDEILRLGTDFAILVADTIMPEVQPSDTDAAGHRMDPELHSDLCTEAISELEGRIIRSHEGSTLAAFLVPAAAVRAAADMERRLAHINWILPEEERADLRIGIHAVSQRRFRTEARHAVSNSVELARKSGPAQILISGSALAMLKLDADLRSHWVGNMPLGGTGRQEDVFEIIWTDTDTYRELRTRVTSPLKKNATASDQAVGGFPPEGGDAVTVAAVPDSSDPTLVPGTLSLPARYEILQELGAGGMGIVYKVHDRETGEVLALKVLRPEIAADPAGLERFKNELRLARKVTHRNVCRIYDFNRSAGTAFITMEYIEGDTLHEIVSGHRCLELERGIGIARQICAALREAHQQNIIHRDLKPSNIMIDREGNVKIMDFGIARSMDASLTITGMVLGTPAYMAPEQAEGKAVDARTDIYLLGLILYEMFTGAVAFTGDTPFLVALKQMRESPPSPRMIQPDLPARIERVVLRCLQKDPALRFPSVDDLETALSSEEAQAQNA